MPRPASRSRHAGVDFRGGKRPNATHAPAPGPQARLCRKPPGAGAMPGFLGHALMDMRRVPPQVRGTRRLRSGLAVQGGLGRAGGRAERRAALGMMHRRSPGPAADARQGGADGGAAARRTRTGGAAMGSSGRRRVRGRSRAGLHRAPCRAERAVPGHRRTDRAAQGPRAVAEASAALRGAFRPVRDGGRRGAGRASRRRAGALPLRPHPGGGKPRPPAAAAGHLEAAAAAPPVPGGEKGRKIAPPRPERRKPSARTVFRRPARTQAFIWTHAVRPGRVPPAPRRPRPRVPASAATVLASELYGHVNAWRYRLMMTCLAAPSSAVPADACPISGTADPPLSGPSSIGGARPRAGARRMQKQSGGCPPADKARRLRNISGGGARVAIGDLMPESPDRSAPTAEPPGEGLRAVWAAEAFSLARRSIPAPVVSIHPSNFSSTAASTVSGARAGTCQSGASPCGVAAGRLTAAAPSGASRANSRGQPRREMIARLRRRPPSAWGGRLMQPTLRCRAASGIAASANRSGGRKLPHAEDVGGALRFLSPDRAAACPAAGSRASDGPPDLPCCTRRARESHRESNIVARWHEQTAEADLRDLQLERV